VREGCRVEVFKNGVRRKILWHKKDEVTRKWRKLHNEEHHDYLPDHTIVGILILATQQEGWVLPLRTHIMGAVHHKMGMHSSQLIVSRCRDTA